MRGKKGQETGGSAATLIAIIALIMILYLIFLPPAERIKILEGGNSTTLGSDIDENDTLFLERPGRVDYLKRDEIDHNIPSFGLSVTTEGQLIKEIDSAYISNSLFSRGVEENISFSIDKENTENVLLSFKTLTHEGKLIVKVNGNVIFNSEITSSQINPIKIRKEFLNDENTIVFSVSDPGVAFWSGNEYSLQDVRINGDVTDLSKSSSRSIFIVNREEINNLDSARLQFFPDCNINQIGKLTVLLNGNEIFSGLPDCDIINSYEFSKSYMREDVNEIRFVSQEGNYLIDKITVKTKLKKPQDLIYYFELSDTQYDKVVSDDYRLRIRLEFVDDTSEKEGEIILNNRKHYFQTDEEEYVRYFDEFAEKGFNAIKLVPQQTMYITEISAEIVK